MSIPPVKRVAIFTNARTAFSSPLGQKENGIPLIDRAKKPIRAILLAAWSLRTKLATHCSRHLCTAKFQLNVSTNSRVRDVSVCIARRWDSMQS